MSDVAGIRESITNFDKTTKQGSSSILIQLNSFVDSLLKQDVTQLGVLEQTYNFIYHYVPQAVESEL